MIRSKSLATLTVFAVFGIAAGTAQAQKQDYPTWIYDQMVPTGPFLQHMDEAQPLPAAPPSHWAAMGTDGQFRASMGHYGTDVKNPNSQFYPKTRTLTPPRKTAQETAREYRDLNIAAPHTVHIGD